MNKRDTKGNRQFERPRLSLSTAQFQIILQTP
ncbi:hypothetical protein PanWU01x14_024400 [Parasponia andersonii]|uniref:Uncharacterized protein n=1 Tax=Parasponia andersonii TaxID=3476 RepID=A0A2P5DWL9_PARAD|nr:hypothetical protein PanWU01x14_024400 [Parasponia andersonii]